MKVTSNRMLSYSLASENILKILGTLTGARGAEWIQLVQDMDLDQLL
jgi:hypothetical protein